jgi:hypothetical protein
MVSKACDDNENSRDNKDRPVNFMQVPLFGEFEKPGYLRIQGRKDSVHSFLIRLAVGLEQQLYLNLSNLINRICHNKYEITQAICPITQVSFKSIFSHELH